MNEEIMRSKVKCPKCRSKNLTLTELWKNHSIDWDVNDGIFDKNDGELNPGDPYKVISLCKQCNHVWTIRGALQITDVTNDKNI